MDSGLPTDSDALPAKGASIDRLERLGDVLTYSTRRSAYQRFPHPVEVTIKWLAYAEREAVL